MGAKPIRWTVATAAAIAAFAAVIPAGAATITVSNASDVVNGNTTNPDTLQNNPGGDGISLREAVIAANNSVGPHTISFKSELAGQTIVLTSPLSIVRNGITISGLVANNKPDITVDGRNINGPTLHIAASSFTLRHVRFVHVPDGYSTISVGSQVAGLPAGPNKMANLRFSANSFSHVGMTKGFAIGATGFFNNRTLSNVVIDNNTFNNTFEAVNIPTSGSGNTIDGLLIYRNSFSNMTAFASSAVECGVHDGKNNRMINIRIAENTFTITASASISTSTGMAAPRGSTRQRPAMSSMAQSSKATCLLETAKRSEWQAALATMSSGRPAT